MAVTLSYFLPIPGTMTMFTDVTIVLDRSGSMAPIRDSTLRGLNGFIAEQKTVPGDGCWSLVQFNQDYHETWLRVHQSQVPVLTPEDYLPAGGTALLDAVCRAIMAVEARISALPEVNRPDKVLFIIVTDGEENSSKEFRPYQMQSMIRARQARGWQFVFLGANQDAIAVGTTYSILPQSCLSYGATDVGTQRMFKSVSLAISSYRMDEQKTSAMAFTEEDRKAQEEAAKVVDMPIIVKP